MTSRHKLIGGITGLLYAFGWFGYDFFVTVQTVRCYTQFIDAVVNLNIKWYIIGQQVPIMICNFLVVLKLSWKIYKCFKKGIYNDCDQDQSKLCRHHHLTYVKNLLKRNSPQRCDGTRLPLVEKIQNVIVRPVPGFRFPISIIITVFMSAIMLYSISLTLVYAMDIISKYFKSLPDIPDLLQAANAVATTLTVLCGMRNIYIFLINYRTDMLSLYKGDRSFIPETVHHSTPDVYMAHGMRFIGTSITGMLWGSLLCFLMVYIPLATMMILVKLVVVSGKIKYLWREFEWLVYPVCMIIIFKVQTFFIGRFFMQPKIHDNDKHRPLAVDNRNAYNIFSFFMVFLNASVGVFSFLKRILVSAILGVFLIPRMDRCLLMRGYEDKDKCYVNYIGMIMVDVAHNHPVLRTFCHLLKSEIEDRMETKHPRSGEHAIDSFARNSSTSSTNIRNRRWWLAYTSIRNPSLSVMRVHETKKDTHINPIVDLNEINCSNIESTEVKNQPEDIWDCSCRPICCKEYKFRIPPNLLTNMFAVIVLLSIIIIIACASLLINSNM
ncbi:stimulated by retinoic acid gene 6 protein-like isoform X2 [Mercenaria mercenaria]|nr:stimulated by retinoic acid gene 6 protein-like isoform X2 [Mercenaria mercenaria]